MGERLDFQAREIAFGVQYTIPPSVGVFDHKCVGKRSLEVLPPELGPAMMDALMCIAGNEEFL